MPEKKKRNRKLIVGIFATLFIVLGSIIYFRYYYVYSEGTRVGILYKFSKKGAIFKTYEGEMVLPGIKFRQQNSGVSSNMFLFSVDDAVLADSLMNCQGMEVELHYSQYNAGLPWRGDTYENQEGQYVVDRLVRIKNESPNGYGL